MFQVNHLSVTHTRDLRSMISDFSLVLQPGDKAALIGEEGDGKSTLLKLLYDERLVSGSGRGGADLLEPGFSSHPARGSRPSEVSEPPSGPAQLGPPPGAAVRR